MKLSIPFNSATGIRLTDYFTRCKEANKAAQEFLMTAHQQYRFIPCTEQTEYITPADSEAGGIMAICYDRETFNAHKDEIDQNIWSVVEDPKDNTLYIYPRITIEPHFMRHDKAVRLHTNHSPEWKFRMDGEKVRSYLYKDIQQQCPPEDRKALTPKSRTTPPPALHVALGIKYVVNDNDNDNENSLRPGSKPFSEAVELYEAINALPVVPNNTLASILQVKAKDKIRPSDISLSWEIDEANEQYIFNLGNCLTVET